MAKNGSEFRYTVRINFIFYQTCIKRSPLEQRKSSLTGQERVDLLIQVTA
jgi:hypothetical protein